MSGSSSPLDLLAQAELLLESASPSEAVDISAQAVRALASSGAAADVRGRVLVKHAEILHKLERYTEAVEAAKTATQLVPPPWNAFLRLGMAAFALEEYEAALAAFARGAELAKSLPAAVQSTFATWVRKCRAELEAEMEGDLAAPAAAAAAAAAEAPPPAAAGAPSAAAPALRYQFYQSMDWVTCDFYCKGRTADDVLVEFRDRKSTRLNS